MNKLSGLHHVTAITGNAQANIDFYTRVLGLGLVKLTVNFDDPKSYHLYYGDDSGRPGTILTFFAWPGARQGRAGAPQISSATFAVGSGSLRAWAAHLDSHAVKHCVVTEKKSIELQDPDGMKIALTESGEGTTGASQPLRVQQISGVSLTEASPRTTADFLTSQLGFRSIDNHGAVTRLEIGDGGQRAVVEILQASGSGRGSLGAGVIHHVAWRAADDASQAGWLDQFQSNNVGVSPVMDRTYFTPSISMKPVACCLRLLPIIRDLPLMNLPRNLAHQSVSRPGLSRIGRRLKQTFRRFGCPMEPPSGLVRSTYAD